MLFCPFLKVGKSRRELRFPTLMISLSGTSFPD